MPVLIVRRYSFGWHNQIEYFGKKEGYLSLVMDNRGVRTQSLRLAAALLCPHSWFIPRSDTLTRHGDYTPLPKWPKT